MSERKVQNKYYPPDYDPSKVPRVKRKSKQNDVRIMAPLNMKCNTCGNYIASATKFNAKKETVEDETYNNLMIFRFYIKCPRCMATIIFRTNLKEHSYEVEQGATENFMALKMAEKQAREEAEAEEEEEKIDPMKQLEKRTKASKQQMEASEQIHCLRTLKHKMLSIDIDAVIKSKQEEASRDTVLAITDDGHKSDDEIRVEAKRLLKRKTFEKSNETCPTKMVAPGGSSSKPKPGPNTGGSKMLSSSLMSLKKKIKVAPRTSSGATT